MERRFDNIRESSSSPSPSPSPSSTTVQAMDDDDDIVYVAVGKEVEESKPTVLWALQNFGGRFCILHVHHHSKTVPPSRLAAELRITQAYERQKMHKILDDYLQICYRAQVPAEKLHIEMDDVGKGIVELIYRHSIKKLVMAAAANKHYSEQMTGLKSVKALYVNQLVPHACQVWFICNGHLIHSREGDDFYEEVRSPLSLSRASSISETGQSNPERSPSPCSSRSTCPSSEEVRSPLSQGSSISETGQSNPETILSSRSSQNVDEEVVSPLSRASSISVTVQSNLERSPSPCSSHSTYSSSEEVRSPLSRGSSISETRQSNPETILSSRSSHNVDEEVVSPLSRASSISEIGQSNPESSPPRFSHLTFSSSEVVGDSDLVPFERTEESIWPQSEEDTSRILDRSSIDQLYNQLEQALVEAEKLKQDAFEESVRRIKAEKAVIEAARKARALESSYTEELRRRKEIQEALAKQKEDFEKMKQQHDKESLIDQKLPLERQVVSSNHMMKELDEEMVSARELLQFLKKEQDELQVEHGSALKVTKEPLKKQTEEASSSHINQFFSEFSVSEIEEATCYLESSLKIGEGGYVSIYKGLLRHTPVAIKVLLPSSMQGPLEFQQEVDILSKLRHPNLVTLIGVCPEICALIYEYLPNGSLEDRLSCKDNTPPLSWQTRIRIATQLCSVLIFLHSGNPHRIVHGDLEPRNILLDENFVCKLSDFGICRALSLYESSSNMTLFEDTFLYLDPQFHATGELSTKSDIYSFGIILLQLLTGMSPLGIAKEVQDAINEGNLTALLDPLAGDWPFVQAKQLAHLALRCCEMDPSDRPDLLLEVWRMLEPMRASCRASSTFYLGPEEHREPPSYFICPILQEVMQDPHVAADGYTYEAEAITGWLESGHETSPMTNLTLAHLNLVPNHALRSAIQEWLQQH